MIGKHILDLPPTPENKRNSEGAFIRLNNGDILFAYSRYSNDAFDSKPADIYGIISKDGGESFSDPFPIIKHEDICADNIMSISFIPMQNGDVGMFFLIKKGENCFLVLSRSSDDGKSWSDPERCIKEDGYFCVNNDRVRRLKNGRLIFPAGYNACASDAINCKPMTTWIFASEDDGESWTAIAKDIALPECRAITTGLQEPGILELADGRLWCYMRTDAGRQYECFSSDGGYSWSQPMPSPFTSPVSPLCTKSLSDGRIVAVWNPCPFYNGHPVAPQPWAWWAIPRNPLVMAVSDNGGENFSYSPKVLENDPDSGYCYTAIFETDDAILLGYCAGSKNDGGNLNRLRIRKIDKNEL